MWNTKEKKLLCPRCGRERIYTSSNIVNDKDWIWCEDCGYGQYAKRFKDAWKIRNKDERKTN